jgi:hypothetical protein
MAGQSKLNLKTAVKYCTIASAGVCCKRTTSLGQGR